MINWIDDSISAVISTFLAIGVSWYFYHKANRDAFYSDILNPIGDSSKDKMTATIAERKKLYAYRYACKKEKAAIDTLEKASKSCDKYSFEYVFSEAIWNYFYDKCQITRKHVSYIPEADEWIEEDNEPTYQLDLKRYANYYREDGSYDSWYQEDLKNELMAFAESNIEKAVDLECLFENESVDKVVEGSPEYTEFKKANQEYDLAISSVKGLMK